MNMNYLPGDIIGVKTTSGISLIISKLMRLFITPWTDLYHFFVKDEQDYEIKEAIASGIKDGRLSFYNNKEYRVFRIPIAASRKRANMACAKFSRYGRVSYDWWLAVKLFVGAFKCWFLQALKEGRFRKIRPEELPYVRDDEFVCTEVAYEVSYLMGYPIVHPDTACIPPAIIASLNSGRIVEVT
jgi:hypothetical protein